MEPIYIIAIVVFAIIFVLVIACVYMLSKQHMFAEEERAELNAVYSDPNLAKMEYDIAFYDDIPTRTQKTEGDTQVTIEDVMDDGSHAPGGAVFTKVDDGMEEISGHYEEDK